MIDNYQIVLLDGMTVNEAVTQNEDLSYTIFINQNLCEAKRLQAVKHALNHIDKEDFDRYDVQSVEFQRHAM